MRPGAQIASLSTLRATSGEGSRLEAEQAVAERDARKAVQANAEADVASAAYRLAALVGAPPENIVPELLVSAWAIPSPPDTIASGIRSDLLERRPDIRDSRTANWPPRLPGSASPRRTSIRGISLIGSIGVQAGGSGESGRWRQPAVQRRPQLPAGRSSRWAAFVRRSAPPMPGLTARRQPTRAFWSRRWPKPKAPPTALPPASSASPSVRASLDREKEAMRLSLSCCSTAGKPPEFRSSRHG